MNFVLSQRVIGYYLQWVLGSLSQSEIDFNVVTHVIHSFAWPIEDGSNFSYDGMFGYSYYLVKLYQAVSIVYCGIVKNMQAVNILSVLSTVKM